MEKAAGRTAPCRPTLNQLLSMLDVEMFSDLVSQNLRLKLLRCSDWKVRSFCRRLAGGAAPCRYCREVFDDVSSRPVMDDAFHEEMIAGLDGGREQ